MPFSIQEQLNNTRLQRKAARLAQPYIPSDDLQTDEDREADCEMYLASRTDLDEPAYPLRGVYFIACGKWIKIGVSDSVLKRFKELNQVIPVPIEPIGWVPCPGTRAELVTLEMSLHEQFASSRGKGEWFITSPELVAYIGAHAQSWPTR